MSTIFSISKKQNDTVKAKNKAANDGKMKYEDCGQKLKNIKSKKGVTTPKNQAQVHHDPAIEKGGSKAKSKGVVLCPPCHKDRHDEK